MGNYRVEVEAVGGHGCQREKKDGEKVEGCGQPGCPDCITRDFVGKLKSAGNSVNSAKLTHWPGQPSSVTEDLLSGVRSGSF